MESLSVFQYRSARRFLLDYVELKKKSDASFSIRRWSKEMGLGSHALLIMILQGKRTLTLKQAPYIAQGAKLTTPEQMYFQALIQLENAKTPEEERFCKNVLAIS